MPYKRNQVEAAISKVLEPTAAAPSPDLRTRLKRLLDTDRTMGRAARSNDPDKNNFAFYSDEPPGRGVEIWFSEYETFALMVALMLMQHGWTQSFAVFVLRRVRTDLKRQHTRVLRLDKAELFDQDAIYRKTKAGDPAFTNNDPVLLTIVSVHGRQRNEESKPVACEVHRGMQEAQGWATNSVKGKGGGWSMFEITSIAHQLADQLET